MPEEPTSYQKPEQKVRSAGKMFGSAISDFFQHLIDLKEGLDKEGTIIQIRNNKRMYGANAWMLMCSIMIASLGLDLNSPAVIIGAMLISPLMSPILGVGLAIGINDREMLGISLRHFVLAFIIAVVTSFIYFKFMSPFHAATAEIKARTAPTLLDVLVALFGGLAGIISTSRKDQSNAIPGVAIATALMPPLCVTGFGIANGNWVYAINSFYLFFLNSSIIALATYFMSRYLNFPLRQYERKKEERRNRWYLLSFFILLVSPSIYILKGVLTDVNTKKNISAFIEDHFDDALFQFDKELRTDTFEINIIPFKKISESDREMYRQLLYEDYGVKKALLRFPEDLPSLEEKGSGERTENEQMKRLQAERQLLEQSRKENERLQSQIDSLNSLSVINKQLQHEATIIYPELEQLQLYHPADSVADSSALPLLYLKWRGRTTKATEQRLLRFVELRAGLDTCVLAH